MSSKETGTLYYLSGAPRVSTHVDGPTPGPRAHILGIVGAARMQGMFVKAYVAGDSKVARSLFQRGGSEKLGTGKRGWIRDAVRLFLRYTYAVGVAYNAPPPPYVIYERFGTFQTGFMFAKRKATGIVVESNGVFFEEASKDRDNLSFTTIARRLELQTYKQADLVVVVSPDLRKQLLKYDKMLAPKIAVVPNGVDTALYFPPPDMDQLRSRSYKTIGWVGTLVAWQGISELIEAVANFRESSQIDLRIELVGDGPDMGRCRDLVSRLVADEYVVFHGKIDADLVPDYIRSFDIAYSGHLPLAQAPMYHSPLKLYEYMACGVIPVCSVSSDATALLAEAGLNKVIFEESTPFDIGQAIATALRLSDDTTVRSALSRRIANEHSWGSRLSVIMGELDARR